MWPCGLSSIQLRMRNKQQRPISKLIGKTLERYGALCTMSLGVCVRRSSHRCHSFASTVRIYFDIDQMRSNSSTLIHANMQSNVSATKHLYIFCLVCTHSMLDLWYIGEQNTSNVSKWFGNRQLERSFEVRHSHTHTHEHEHTHPLIRAMCRVEWRTGWVRERRKRVRVRTEQMVACVCGVRFDTRRHRRSTDVHKV